MKKYIYKIKEISSKVIIFLDNKRILKLNDETYLKIMYKLKFNKSLDFENLQSLDEKLQWLKINNRKEIYTTMVDKYQAKEYVKNIIGEQYIIPTLHIFNSVEEIDFKKLPNQFVLKCTHDSGSVIVCKDKSKLDIKNVKKKIKKALQRNYYYKYREWPYKNVVPRIIIEPYYEDERTKDLKDYKIYCFDGKCDYVLTCIDRHINEVKFLFFNRDWELQKNMTNDAIKYGDKINVNKPDKLEDMFEIASKLSKGIPFVRTDFYECNGNVYFGELTFFPQAGFDVNRRNETNAILTKELNLEKYK